MLLLSRAEKLRNTTRCTGRCTFFIFEIPNFMTKVGDVLRIVGKAIPEALAREWDNPGLQVGSLNVPARGIIVSLDAELPMLETARGLDANIAVTHHPLIFDPIKRLDLDLPVGKVLAEAIRDGITIYSSHTNLDVMDGGVNDTLAGRLKLLNIRSLEEIGRIGELHDEETVDGLLERLKTEFSLPYVTVAGNRGDRIKRVAVCGGSGGSLIRDAAKNGADVLITGDVKYHAAKEAESYGISVIDIGHFASESVILPVMASLIKEALGKEGISMEPHIHWGNDPLRVC